MPNGISFTVPFLTEQQLKGEQQQLLILQLEFGKIDVWTNELSPGGIKSQI